MPCPLEGCGRPANDPAVREILGLYEECRQRGALPQPGGVFDQPAMLMGWFSVIDRVVADHKRKQAEQRELEWQTSRRT